ncbi:MAG: polysaccharide deacetylase [Bacillota bacterium]|nr:polysaccharide deacetylase [Bacillota bacterium]
MNKYIKILINVMVIFLFLNTADLINNVNKAYADESPKKVYLTFDDGPTYVITNKILDILQRYKVKGTFFIVGKEIDGKEKILNRIYDEGHGIGVHTYSHNNRLIYRSEEHFIAENILAAEKIKEVTGFYPGVLRFPGGSCFKLTESLLEKLHKNNFKVFDWNASLEDGLNPNLNEVMLVKNALKIKGDRNKVIILMHCNYNNKNTVKALPEIIEKYKSESNNFEPISNLTEEYHYRIKKKRIS